MPLYTGSISVNSVITNPIVPTDGYHLFTFTPTESGWYRIIVDQFGGGGPFGNDMDLAVGYGNTEIDIPAILDYDLNSGGYNIPPETPIKVFSFSGGEDDIIADYFSAGCTYQVLVIGYDGDNGGTYTLTVRDNMLTEGVDNGIMSSFYYTGAYQLYRFIPPQNYSYGFNLDFESGNNADLFISEANTTLDIEGCINFDNGGEQPDSLLAYSIEDGPKTVYSTLTGGSTYEVLVYAYETGDLFENYQLKVFYD